jgi:GTP pyrophosphokinase
MNIANQIAIHYDLKAERREILGRYRKLLSVYRPKPDQEKEDLALIRKAFQISLEAHRNMRRKSGEPYVYHPLEVARICIEEIGLGATSVACALLHDVVEDRSDLYSIDDIQRLFGDKIASICEGLTKIKEIFDHTEPSDQASHYKKLLVTLSDDVRVILIKLADRLHNMRTLEYMRTDKQLRIAAETTFLFAPLAHRLGLYAIKSELEDLALKFTEPEIYRDISRRLYESDNIREGFANDFLYPIKKDLAELGLPFRILVRNKSIYSIWQKMKKKQIPFDEVFDVFAIRIILDVPVKQERAACWETYSIVTSHYRPKPDRMRDWISIPRANGYQALHTTVMSSVGKWVEVQIRTERMDDIAEKGYAAHWKYKGDYHDDRNVENWLDRIRDMLHKNDSEALDFLDDLQGYLFTQEIFVFTPQGELRILPAGSTVLDFAYAIHSDVGNNCIGANVNHRLKPRYYELKSGDQIEVLTSKKQEPADEWLPHVKTSRARAKIREYIREKKKMFYEEGEKKTKQYFEKFGIDFGEEKLDLAMTKTQRPTLLDFYYDIATGALTEKYLRSVLLSHNKSWFAMLNPFQRARPAEPSTLSEQIIQQLRKNDELQLLDRNLENINYLVAPCCKPIPGDDVMGYIDHRRGIIIHRSQCPEAIQLMSTFGHNIVKVKWTEDLNFSVMAGIKISSLDRKGLLHDISDIISKDMNVNIKSVHFDTDEGVSEGIVFMYVQNTLQLNGIINKLRRIDGVQGVNRIDNYTGAEG